MESIPEDYSKVLIIGTGFAGLCAAARLVKEVGETDIMLVERNEGFGGTWWVSKYPGCASDVPSTHYSFSFHLKGNWSRSLPPHNEIQEYLEDVAATYGLQNKTLFRTECVEARWEDNDQKWIVTLLDIDSGTKFIRRCSILFSGTGIFHGPHEQTIKGQETFNGPVIHTARWIPGTNLSGKNVVVVGNGCSGSQIVPAILPEAKSVTWIFRTQQWYQAAFEVSFSPLVKGIFDKLNSVMRFFRWFMYCFLELEYQSHIFETTERGAKERDSRAEKLTKYMKENVPEEYHDIVIPKKTDLVGCKRRVQDAGFLKALHDPKIRPVKSEVVEILPDGVRVSTGEVVNADVIVLATGYDTNREKNQFKMIGKGGETLEEHWNHFGGAEAYKTISLSGFPNFFMLLGPNAHTGHGTNVFFIECAVSLCLEVCKPVLQGKKSSVEPMFSAEKEWVATMQTDLKQRIWSMEDCTNWVASPSWSPTMWPYSLLNYWWQCKHVSWKDWKYIS